MDEACALALALRRKPGIGPFGGWALYPVPEDGAHHVVPDDESDYVIIHNSADGRGRFERGERRVS